MEVLQKLKNRDIMWFSSLILGSQRKHALYKHAHHALSSSYVMASNEVPVSIQ